MRQIITLIVFLVSTSVEAENNFYISGGLGTGKLDVGPEFQVNNVKEINDTVNLKLLVGFRFENKIQVEAGHITHGSLDILSLDIFNSSASSSMSENVISLGYSLDLKPKIKITPKILYSFWEFTSIEGWTLNGGPVKQFKMKGRDIIYTISASYSDLYVLYQSGNYGFGDAKFIMVGYKFGI